MSNPREFDLLITREGRHNNTIADNAALCVPPFRIDPNRAKEIEK